MDLNETMIMEISQIFGALGDASRLRILRVLMAAGTPLPQFEIAEATGLSQANASKHLIHLVRVGLLAREKQGNLVLFSLATPLVAEVCDLVCAQVKQRIHSAYSFCK
jgi:DNA-binding transcriptional ArsR family regulator